MLCPATPICGERAGPEGRRGRGERVGREGGRGRGGSEWRGEGGRGGRGREWRE